MTDLQRHQDTSWIETIRPRPAWFRKFLRGILYGIGHLMFTINVKGREFIPRSGPLIVVGNHFSIWDPPLMVYALPMPLKILAAGDMEWPLSQAWALYLYGYIPTNRDSLKPSTIREAKAALERGGYLGIFPEAGMSPNYQLGKGKPGAVYLSHITGCRILPLGFSGYADADDYWRNLHRAPLRIRIGKPFGPYALSQDPEQKRSQMESYSHDIMRHIAALLPPAWRGRYLADPAVRKYALYSFE